MVSVGDLHLELYFLLDQCVINILDENEIIVVVVAVVAVVSVVVVVVVVVVGVRVGATVAVT